VSEERERDKGTTITALRAEIAQLRRALEWYANVDNYDAFDTLGLLQEQSGRWTNDRGMRARKALRQELPE
jgi:hypothetical protein